jgi:hypothetical protein
MRVGIALALLLLPFTAGAQCFFEDAFLEDSFTEDAFFEGCTGSVAVSVPNVIGEASSAAADTILEGVGLDLGGVNERCSAAADNEVIAQSPAPGALVALGALVDVIVSNGVVCTAIPGSGVRLRGLRMRGL